MEESTEIKPIRKYHHKRQSKIRRNVKSFVSKESNIPHSPTPSSVSECNIDNQWKAPNPTLPPPVYVYHNSIITQEIPTRTINPLKIQWPEYKKGPPAPIFTFGERNIWSYP
jgi:hypothetical protein